MNLISNQLSNKPRGIIVLIGLNTFIAFSQLIIAAYQTSNRLIPNGSELVEIRENLPSEESFLVGGAFHLLLAYGLGQGKGWIRHIQNLAAFPYLLSFPFGTIYAILAFLYVNSKAADSYFSNRI
jgi:hypothetical protein